MGAGHGWGGGGVGVGSEAMETGDGAVGRMNGEGGGGT